MLTFFRCRLVALPPMIMCPPASTRTLLFTVMMTATAARRWVMLAADLTAAAPAWVAMTGFVVVAGGACMVIEEIRDCDVGDEGG